MCPVAPIQDWNDYCQDRQSGQQGYRYPSQRCYQIFHNTFYFVIARQKYENKPHFPNIAICFPRDSHIGSPDDYDSMILREPAAGDNNYIGNDYLCLSINIKNIK